MCRDIWAAVTPSLAETGRIVTAAGAIMIVVFASFALRDERVATLVGIGLAVAVVIDAFVIRAALLPVLMHMFGAAIWRLPPRLDQAVPRVWGQVSG